MMNLTPFIRFNDGTCTEAMNFYKDTLGAKIDSLMTIADSPMAKDMPADKQKNVMHSTLSLKGKLLFIGMDMMRDKAVVGDNVGISLECESATELDTIFNKLAEGGDVFMKPEEQFWGGYFAVVTDKYGVEWMLNFQKTPMK